MHRIGLALLLATLGPLAPGCSDDGASLIDGQIAEQGPAELGFVDGSQPDSGGLDAPAPDSVEPADGPLKLDGATPADAVSPSDHTPLHDGAKACAGDQDCKVFEDCCKCEAVFSWQNKGICKMACTDKACTSQLKLSQATAYCLDSKCFLGDAASCSADSDCKVVNDCCSCLALPAGNAAPSCTISACLVSTCTAMGVSAAQAKCVSGMCRLVVP